MANSRAVEMLHVGDFVQDLIELDGAVAITAVQQSNDVYIVSWMLSGSSLATS